MTTHDVLVLGRGLAGAVLVEELMQRGLRVHVFDRPQAGQASPAAAGVVNPIVLRRDIPSWRAAELLPIATRFYQDVEARLSEHLWHPIELVKVFPSTREAQQWDRAMAAPDSAAFVSRKEHPELRAAGIAAPHGQGTVTSAAWLDVVRFLHVQRTRLLEEGRLSEERVPNEHMQYASGVRIGHRTAPLLVRCEGPFADLPGLVPVKGETLVVRLPGIHLSCMVHRGVFVLPLGGERYRVGATFQWNEVWSGPSQQAREHLLRGVRALVPVEPEVLAHDAGVRPAARDRRPILGRTGPHTAVMNGLGARGVLLAPWCAAHLADHVLNGAALDPEVDLRRFT